MVCPYCECDTLCFLVLSIVQCSQYTRVHYRLKEGTPANYPATVKQVYPNHNHLQQSIFAEGIIEKGYRLRNQSRLFTGLKDFN